VLVPVLAGSSGAGASTFAAVAVDVLQQAGRCALLVDTAEPARSGLSASVTVAGTEMTEVAPGVGVRWSWRGLSVVAQLESRLPALTPLPLLAPEQWLPASGLSPLHVTLVDLGQQWSAPTATLLRGASGWLALGADRSAGPCPVLVVRPTRASLLAAEAALAQLDPWTTTRQAAAPARMVVMASARRRWPKHVVGAAGARVAALLPDAVFVPYDDELAVGGIEAHPTPPRVQDAVAQLLDDWGLLTPARPAHQPSPLSQTTGRGWVELSGRRAADGSPLYLPAV
jgi:hypothetical protein